MFFSSSGFAERQPVGAGSVAVGSDIAKKILVVLPSKSSTRQHWTALSNGATYASGSLGASKKTVWLEIPAADAGCVFVLEVSNERREVVDVFSVRLPSVSPGWLSSAVVGGVTAAVVGFVSYWFQTCLAEVLSRQRSLLLAKYDLDQYQRVAAESVKVGDSVYDFKLSSVVREEKLRLAWGYSSYVCRLDAIRSILLDWKAANKNDMKARKDIMDRLDGV